MGKKITVVLTLIIILVSVTLAYVFWPRPVCRTDVDCDDSNEYTQDSCIFPAELNSHCDHQAIVCLKDSDCGESGFGNNYCEEDTIKKDYTTISCINAGTPQSFCSEIKEAQTVEECRFPYLCEEGNCKKNECINIPGAVNSGSALSSRVYFEDSYNNNQLSLLITKSGAVFKIHIFDDKNGLPDKLLFSSDAFNDGSIDELGWLKINLDGIGTMIPGYYWIVTEIVDLDELAFNTCTYVDRNSDTYSIVNHYEDHEFRYELTKENVLDIDVVHIFE